MRVPGGVRGLLSFHRVAEEGYSHFVDSGLKEQ